MTQKQINEIAYKVVGCAIEVHKFHGPGSLESVYQVCLIDELKAVVIMINIWLKPCLSATCIATALRPWQLINRWLLDFSPKIYSFRVGSTFIAESLAPLVTEAFWETTNDLVFLQCS